MTFIIALGIIIVLLCSASIFKLMQPPTHQTSRQPKKAKVSHPSKKTAKKAEKPQKPVKKTVSEPAFHVESSDEPPVEKHAPKIDTAPITADMPEMITLNLAAEKGRPYAGYELLQTLLTSGMRFGSMNLFHRHEKKTGVGPVLFSLAACTADGTFDLTKIGNFSCNGLVLFMRPHEVEQPRAVFETMLKTADIIVQALGGTVLNAHQQLLKKADVVELYQQLQPAELVPSEMHE